jgi:hypothetical protein
LTVDISKLRRNFINKFNIVQSSRENHTSELKFSKHVTDLMLINGEGQPQFHLDLNLPGIDVCQVQGLEGKFYPSACLLNPSGVGYFTVLFDEMSLRFLLGSQKLVMGYNSKMFLLEYLM